MIHEGIDYSLRGLEAYYFQSNSDFGRIRKNALRTNYRNSVLMEQRKNGINENINFDANREELPLKHLDSNSNVDKNSNIDKTANKEAVSFVTEKSIDISNESLKRAQMLAKWDEDDVFCINQDDVLLSPSSSFSSSFSYRSGRSFPKISSLTMKQHHWSLLMSLPAENDEQQQCNDMRKYYFYCRSRMARSWQQQRRHCRVHVIKKDLGLLSRRMDTEQICQMNSKLLFEACR